MRSPAQTAITWLAACLFAAMSLVGEGLHWLPGCGHAVPLPGGYVFVGIDKAQAGPFADGNTPGITRQPCDWPLVLDEDECPICRLLATGQSPGQTVAFLLHSPIGEHLLAIFAGDVHLQTARAFQARAPPLG